MNTPNPSRVTDEHVRRAHQLTQQTGRYHDPRRVAYLMIMNTLKKYERTRVFLGAWKCTTCDTVSCGSHVADHDGQCPVCKSELIGRYV